VVSAWKCSFIIFHFTYFRGKGLSGTSFRNERRLMVAMRGQ
jgi:hypothetical protein